MEIVRGEDEEPLLPPGEEPVPLVPDDPLPDHLLGVGLTLVLTRLLERVPIHYLEVEMWR